MIQIDYDLWFELWCVPYSTRYQPPTADAVRTVRAVEQAAIRKYQQERGTP